MESISLTPQEIFEELIKGNDVAIQLFEGDTAANKEAADSLLQHLVTIKSRAKKQYESLGLDFMTSVIKYRLDEETNIATYHLSAPKKRRVYSGYVIINKEQNNGDDSKDGDGSPQKV